MCCCQVRHDDRGDLCRGLRAAQQRGDGAGAGVRDEEQAGVRPGNIALDHHSDVTKVHTNVRNQSRRRPMVESAFTFKTLLRHYD